MIGTLKTMAAAALLAASASMVNAALQTRLKCRPACAAMSFRCTATIVRASADPVAGIVTIGMANVVRAASGVARAVVLIPASSSVRSGTATIEAGSRHSAGSGGRPFQCKGGSASLQGRVGFFAAALGDDRTRGR
jgi:hypothetical protein